MMSKRQTFTDSNSKCLSNAYHTISWYQQQKLLSPHFTWFQQQDQGSGKLFFDYANCNMCSTLDESGWENSHIHGLGVCRTSILLPKTNCWIRPYISGYHCTLGGLEAQDLMMIKCHNMSCQRKVYFFNPDSVSESLSVANKDKLF